MRKVRGVYIFKGGSSSGGMRGEEGGERERGERERGK